MENLTASELILNKNGSIYHLDLLPEQLAKTIITVGDPDRVEKITRYFDSVEFKVRKREFHTQTGFYKGKRISVVSTGIGTDNIDIVLNELDALVNIDFKNRRIKRELAQLNIIRLGTSGAIQPEIPVNSFLLSEMAIGFDSLLHFYKNQETQHREILIALENQLQLDPNLSKPYIAFCNRELAAKFSEENVHKGITGTNVGFYGPQGRVLRLPLRDKNLNNKIENFNFNGKKITNLEMETAGIYGLAKLMNHKAVSLNAILANRATGKFSKNPEETIDSLIELTLKSLISKD